MCVQDKITTFNEMKGNLKTHSCSFSRMCTLSDLKLPSHLKTIVCVYSTELRLSLNFDTMKGNMNY